MRYGKIQGRYSIRIDYTDESNKPVNKKIKIDNVSYITAGSSITAAIKNDGSLWTWGLNNYGALGNGADYTKTFKVDSKPYNILNDVKSDSLGEDWGIAVKNDGALWMWSSKNESYTTPPIHVYDNADGITQVLGNESISLVLFNNGKLYRFTAEESLSLVMESVINVSIYGNHCLV